MIEIKLLTINLVYAIDVYAQQVCNFFRERI